MKKFPRGHRLEMTMKIQIMQTLFQRKVRTGKTPYSSPNITIKQYMKKDTVQQKAAEEFDD